MGNKINFKTAQNIGATVGIVVLAFTKGAEKTKCLSPKTIKGLYCVGFGSLGISVAPSIYKNIKETDCIDRLAGIIVKAAPYQLPVNGGRQC